MTISLSHYHYNKGFTLLELLISVSLSVLLMMLLVLALNSISRDWQKQGHQLDHKLDKSLLLLQLEKAFIGTFPYEYKETLLDKKKLFFSGTSTEIQWISTVSPDRSKGLTLWHLKAEGSSGFTLSALAAYPGSLKKQLEAYNKAHPELSYYFADYTMSISYLAEDKQEKKQWLTAWDAAQQKKLPLGIRISLQPELNNEGSAGSQQKSRNNFELFSFIRTQL